MQPDPHHPAVFASFEVGGIRGVRRRLAARGLSDRGDLLVWMARLKRKPEQTFVLLGEPAASDALRCENLNLLGRRMRVPHQGKEVKA